MTRSRVATISGTMLAPGVSKNGRLYTREHIAGAVQALQERLADPAALPATMLTHHAAGDDSTRIAGRLTGVTLGEDGSARFTADLADNEAGRTIAALVTPDSPYLKSVSIRGWWDGAVRTVTHEGRQVETADGLIVDGLDFTKTPGVTGARIDKATVAETTGRTYVTESVEAHLMTDPTPETVYADPGYHTDGVKRLPLGTLPDIRKAWTATFETAGYTPKQVKRMRSRIKEAAKGHGVNIVAESTALTAAVTEALEEAWAQMSVDSGPGEVRVAGYTSDPSNLAAIGRKVALAALAGLAALDPDADGDIDLDDPADEAHTSDSGTSVAETDTKEAPVAETTAAVESAAPPKPLHEMSEEEVRAYAASLAETAAKPVEAEKPKAEEAAPEAKTETSEVKPVDESDLDARIAAAVAEALKAKPVEETVPVAEKSVAEQVAEALATETAKLREEIIGEARTIVARSGRRKGVIGEATEAAKPLHEMDDDDLHRHEVGVWGSVL